MKYLCLRCFVWEGIHPLPHKKNAIVAHQTPLHSPRLLHKPHPLWALSGNVLYFLVAVDQRVDNFDQRLTTDLQMFLDSFFGQVTGSA